MAYRAKIEERLRLQDVGKKEKRDEEQRYLSLSHNDLTTSIRTVWCKPSATY